VILLAQLFETPYAVAGAPSCTIFAEDADSGVLIDTAAKGISAVAAKTTANTAAGTWTVDTEKIINVKTIIEEITTRAGWVNGGNINMLYVNTGASGTYVWDNSVVARGFLRLTIIFVADRSPVMMF
ncbi:MAG TPA: hypothetical protein ACFYD4_15835, partial [Candidatus Wunengus sp. YC61]|uniref:hypothetical protein n=1 Tax=Candidatus Wunengus sp. YC61 TaxID=3367698 RepID=UPI004025A416